MTKQEFLLALQKALNGKVPTETVQENVRFYDDYISMEMRRGKSGEEVLEALGDPRLLARTIVTAAESGGAGAAYRSEGGADPSDGCSAQENTAGDFRGNGGIRIPGRLVLIVVLAVVFIVLFAVSSLLYWLLPVLLPLGVIWMLVRYFRRR